MTTFIAPTDGWGTWSLRRTNLRPQTAPGVTAVQPYPSYSPLRDPLPPVPRLPAPLGRERRARRDRRRQDLPVLFDRRSGFDRRAQRAQGPRIDLYC